MRGSCSGNCKSKHFSLEILYNNSISTYWSSHKKKYVSTLRPGQRTKKYTSKHKTLGLAKCKVCEYITSKPTKPGTNCPCCNQTFSQSIRDPRQGARDQHRKRIEQQTRQQPNQPDQQIIPK